MKVFFLSPMEVGLVAHDLEAWSQEVGAVVPADPEHHYDLLSELVVEVELVAHDLEACQEVGAVLPADPEHHYDLLSDFVVVVAHDMAVDPSLPLV